MLRFYVRCLCLLFSILFATSANAATIRHDVADSVYLSHGAQPRFTSIGKVVGPGYVGSGTYIGNRMVLTAGHVTSPSYGNLKFQVNGKSIPAVRVATHPGWNGNVISGVDLGIFELASDPILPSAPLNRSFNALGLPATFVGYGIPGTGRTGEQAYDGKKRASRNTLDARDIAGRPDLLLSDFDSPNRDRFSISGSPDPLEREGQVTHGDSGGAVWMQNGNDWYMTGVISFGWKGPASTPGPFGKYGDGGGYVDVSQHLAWIQSYLCNAGNWNTRFGTTATTLRKGSRDYIPLLESVPEPATGVLATCVFGAVFGLRRRVG